jgi:hypothetical protein
MINIAIKEIPNICLAFASGEVIGIIFMWLWYNARSDIREGKQQRRKRTAA